MPGDVPSVTLEEVVKETVALFQTLYFILEWIYPGTPTRRLTVAILLPSGISIGQFSTCILEDGNTLFMAVNWPDLLVDLKHLHRKWLLSEGSDRIDMYHPKLVELEHFFTAV